jgi:serine/threonine protein phosphatase PrpC
VAVVDGTGSAEEVKEFAHHAAYHAVRVTARRSPMIAILAVAEANADPLSEITTPDGAIVVAVAEEGESWLVASAGDCVAYGWDGEVIQRITTPHTSGQRMRDNGVDEDIARKNDNKLFHSISRATVSSVPTIGTYDPILVLASDGMKLPEKRIAEILTKYTHDTDARAKELVRAA